MGEEDREFKFNNYISRYHSRHTDLMDLLAQYNGRANAAAGRTGQALRLSRQAGHGRQQGLGSLEPGPRRRGAGLLRTTVNTWLVYTRFRFLRGELDPVSYEAEIALVRDTLSASDAPHWKEYLDAWKG